MPINIFSLLHSVILARALFVAADLNIAEHLATKPMTISELATITQTHEPSLKRLVYFLELNDVFKRSDELCFNTEFSLTMCGDHPATIKPFLVHDDETRWNSFGNLGHSIKTGQASFDMLYGKSYFDYLKDQPVLSSRFDQAMTIISAQEDNQIAQAMTFSGIVADIGGGKGQLLKNISQYNSEVTQTVLFDLPATVQAVQDDSIITTKIGGSFFEPIDLKADVFILKRILHDWDDEQALDILKNVSASMSHNSKLYIIDGILDQAQDKKLLAAIDLALLAIFKGKERTMQDINQLLEKAHLKIINITPINDLISAIECKKI